MWSLRRGEPRVKNDSKFYVQPAEVAETLVKEMEDDKVMRGSSVSVRNRYTVYLCPDDYERWRLQEAELLPKLEAHLTRHMRSKRYETPGAISVRLMSDPDLEPGYYGISGDRELLSGIVGKDREASPGGAPSPAGATPASAATAGYNAPGRTAGPTGVASVGPAGMAAARAAAARAAAARAAEAEALSAPASPAIPLSEPIGAPAPSRVDAVPRAPEPARVELPAQREAAASPVPAAAGPATPRGAGDTQLISPRDADDLGLAKQTIVLRANNQLFEFNQGRVIVGRSRDVDFRIENADVSRRHAAFYWADGNIMVKDLGSTNGTMVNGYPVDSTIVHPGDVVLIGDCFITVESR